MKARICLLAGSVGLVAAAFVIQACGETEPAAAGPEADSGADVVDSSPPKEAAAEEDAATCDLSADFTTQIPDASIADGATTSGICLQCASAKCKKQIDACNQDCTCQELAGEALECYLENSANPILCAGNFAGVDNSTQQIAIGLLTCINSGCKVECATEAFQDAGTDADAGN